MNKYGFYLKDGLTDDFAVVLELNDDASAIAEGLKTASGLLDELELLKVGRVSHLLEIRTNGDTIFKIETQVTRSR